MYSRNYIEPIKSRNLKQDFTIRKQWSDTKSGKISWPVKNAWQGIVSFKTHFPEFDESVTPDLLSLQTISMPHQWIEGNLPVSAKCTVCDKTCGSVLRLQDWRCLWCKATVGGGLFLYPWYIIIILWNKSKWLLWREYMIYISQCTSLNRRETVFWYWRVSSLGAHQSHSYTYWQNFLRNLTPGMYCYWYSIAGTHVLYRTFTKEMQPGDTPSVGASTNCDQQPGFRRVLGGEQAARYQPSTCVHQLKKRW